MATSLSNLTDNLSEINKKECKSCKERENISINCKYINHKDNRLIYKCKRYNNKSHKSVDALKEKFPNTYRSCNKDLNKFILLLRKGVYPYEYMDSLERFNETELLSQKSFYSKLNSEDISDEDAKKAWNEFKIKNLGEYHDLYVQSDTLLLADVFESFRNVFVSIYELDPAHFLSAPGLAWRACLNKTGIKLELLTDIKMLLMIESGIRGGMCQTIHKYAKANNKYMKNYYKSNLSSFLVYVDANNLYGWAMCKKLSVSRFKWINVLSIFTENFIKN